MGGNDFVGGFGEHQIADLRASIDVVDWLKSVCVPETNATIGSTSTSGKKTSLVGVPCDCFDSSLMLAELGGSLFASIVPYHKFVVVASAG
jgi:hypothetical protein